MYDDAPNDPGQTKPSHSRASPVPILRDPEERTTSQRRSGPDPTPDRGDGALMGRATQQPTNQSDSALGVRRVRRRRRRRKNPQLCAGELPQEYRAMQTMQAPPERLVKTAHTTHATTKKHTQLRVGQEARYRKKRRTPKSHPSRRAGHVAHGKRERDLDSLLSSSESPGRQRSQKKSSPVSPRRGARATGRSGPRGSLCSPNGHAAAWPRPAPSPSRACRA